jgi:radical SAM superfamily enzyme YgiQ (UPF0313 family)
MRVKGIGMRVLLIAANTERMNILPLPLGLACVAAAVRKAGHDVRLLNLMFEGNTETALRTTIQDFQPEVIGISVRNIDDQNMDAPKFLLLPVREVVAACRRFCDAPTVVGGAGYSIFPASALHYLGANMGIRGEGETVFPAVLKRIAKGLPVTGLPGVYLPDLPPDDRNFCHSLDRLPLPDPELWIPDVPDRADFWIPVQSRRGCPMDCSFCSTSTIEGRPIRRRSPEELAGWLERLVAAGFHNIHFVDNVFNLPLPYAKELCRKILERGLDINVWCLVYPKWIDGELVQLMARIGCREISLGFESGSSRMLRSLRKEFTVVEVRTVSKMFAEAGIERRGFLLLGGPGETRETVEESLRFADFLGLDALKITVGLRIYPGTPLATAALAEGQIGPNDDLLWPRFYLAPGLPDWLPERIADYKRSRIWVM